MRKKLGVKTYLIWAACIIAILVLLARRSQGEMERWWYIEAFFNLFA